jgi:2,3-bisphosphoglycerate-independent phosphoglycerate mutase
MPEWNMHKLPLQYLTMTRYDDTYQGITILFEKDNLQNTLGEVIANNQRTQIRIAETEKYPHVTYFFSGGRENAFPGEERIMIPSPKVATYDLQPEMSAPQVADAIVHALYQSKPRLLLSQLCQYRHGWAYRYIRSRRQSHPNC